MARPAAKRDTQPVLSQAQQQHFAESGYLIIRDCVPLELLDAVDIEIDQLVESDPPAVETTGKHFYFLAPKKLPAADAALRRSNGLQIAETLATAAPLIHGYGHIQVALNIPSWDHIPGGPHIDGYHDPRRPHPFTMLAGIFLGDELKPGNGNLWVWPGSHLAHAQLFRTSGVHALKPTQGHYPVLDAQVQLGDPIPVLAERGDLILAHYLLGHNSGGNTSDRTRRALYYRLSCANGDDQWPKRLTDPFYEYPTIRP